MKKSKTIPGKVYKFVHKQDVSLHLSIKGRSFTTDWLTLEKSGKLTVKCSNLKGYAWDGCSPKYNFTDLVIGTPDGRFDDTTEKPITYYASMVHDVVYQFKDTVPISRKEADLLFLELLKIAGFWWAYVYYFAVRRFGGFYGGWSTKRTELNGIKVLDCSWIADKKKKKH